MSRIAASSFKLKMTFAIEESIILMDKQMAGAQCFINTISRFFFFIFREMRLDISRNSSLKKRIKN